MKGLRAKGRVAGKGGKELLLPCPRCGKEKFYVNIGKKSAWCWNALCHYKINSDADFYALDLTYRPKKVPGVLANIPDLYDPAEYEEARKFLEGRSVDPSHPDIRYAPSQQMLYFRITSPLDGYHPSWHRRSVKEKSWIVLKGTDKDAYWYEPVRWEERRIILVEGCWDALRIGAGSLSLLGAKMSKHHLTGILRRGWEDVALWLDPDQAGIKGSLEMEHMLTGAGCSVRVIRHKCKRPTAPPFETRLVEPGDCGCEKFPQQARQWAAGGYSVGEA